MTAKDVRQGILQAKNNKETAKYGFAQVTLAAAVIGGYYQSWAAGIGALLGLLGLVALISKSRFLTALFALASGVFWFCSVRWLGAQFKMAENTQVMLGIVAAIIGAGGIVAMCDWQHDVANYER
jgi:hypothetical protein